MAKFITSKFFPFISASTAFVFVTKEHRYLNISKFFYLCPFILILSGSFVFFFLLGIIVYLVLCTFVFLPMFDTTVVVSSTVSAICVTACPQEAGKTQSV
jgi:hypothetical protein